MFSLRMLLAVVAISAVYIAGMVYRTEWWQAGILTLTYLIYAAAISAAFLAKQHRAFFVVFAVFGLAYGLSVHYEIYTLPQKVIEELGFQLPLEVRIQLDDPFGAPPQQPPRRHPSDHQGYWQLWAIGHAFVALVISLVAGVVAEALVRKSRSKNGPSGAA